MSVSGHRAWWSPSRPWGFRFSRSDLVVVLVGALVSWFAATWSRDLAILIPFVLGHFFLFCNVFRVGERAELCWSGLLLLTMALHALLGGTSLWLLLLLQCVVSVTVIVGTLCRRDYHGIGCQRINPLGYRPEQREPSPSLLRKLLTGCGVSVRLVDLLQGGDKLQRSSQLERD